MPETLHEFDFDHNFITWVKVINNGIFARIMNNGWKSERIDLHKGVRQGCPLSALLYIMVAEILSILTKHMRSNHRCTHTYK